MGTFGARSGAFSVMLPVKPGDTSAKLMIGGGTLGSSPGSEVGLPVSDATPVVTLNEGNTALVRVENFVAAIGGKFELWLKYEGLNPTCSFKDRGMTVAVSKAKERGATAVICASTGNTSASAAAYAARAKMKCVVLEPAVFATRCSKPLTRYVPTVEPFSVAEVNRPVRL